MSAQVGIPNYKDLINATKLAKLRDEINTICLNFSKMSSKEAIEKRESEKYEDYSKQYDLDLIYLRNMCLNAQNLVNKCNETLYTISNDAIIKHMYLYDQETVSE